MSGKKKKKRLPISQARPTDDCSYHRELLDVCVDRLPRGFLALFLCLPSSPPDPKIELSSQSLRDGNPVRRVGIGRFVKFSRLCETSVYSTESAKSSSAAVWDLALGLFYTRCGGVEFGKVCGAEYLESRRGVEENCRRSLESLACSPPGRASNQLGRVQ